MGFLGNLVGNLIVKGLSIASGDEISEIFGGSGTGEKKELFEKLLQTWNDVFKMEDFFDNPKISELKETVDLPVKEQIDFSLDNNIGHDPICYSCDDNSAEQYQIERNYKAVRQAEKHSKKTITHFKSAKDSIDFVYLTKLYFLNFNHSNPLNMYTTNCFEKDERFYCFFRYKKGDNILTFLYKPYVTNLNSNFIRLTPMDILELSFKSGGKTLSADVYWQPEINTEHDICKPNLFFEKLGRNDVYENLKKFLEKLNAPITAKEKEKAEKERIAKEEKERAARIEQKKKERAEKEERRRAEKSKWKAEIDEDLSKSTAESALDSFLSSDSKESGDSSEDKRQKLAEEYLGKGRSYKEQRNYVNAFNAFGKASILGNIDASIELGKCYLDGDGTEDDEEEAFSIFNELAEQGNAEAQYELGYCYHYGLGTEENKELALEWYKKAAEQGNADAQEVLDNWSEEEDSEENDEQSFIQLKKLAEQGDAEAQCKLGICYYKGLGTEENYEQAFKWVKKSAEQNNADGQFNLGACYEYGVGTEENAEQAFKWYKKAAEQGDARAQYELGIYYKLANIIYEIDLDPNQEEAFKWFKKAAEQGLDDAQFQLGLYYEEENPEEASKWYKKAAEQGHATAQLNLGLYYDKKENLEEAFKWFKKAAEQGDSEAQYICGCGYLGGTGTEENSEEAFKWFKKAAEQGHIEAQNNLGTLYYNGTGTEENNEEAFKWFEKAAEQGHSSAQYNLGYLYENGIGTEKNTEQAFDWYKKAADQGDADAQDKLDNWSDEEEKYAVTAHLKKKTKFNVVLEAVDPDKKIPIIMAVREVIGISLEEAYVIIKDVPKTLKEDISKEEANKIKSIVNAAGGRVKIV